ncbi:MAG: response regulator [Deltaproteobacteria bacterium]|nr:response regulator [Deltaproteobacteria bacterium]MBW2417113.1 response regulator [Deltaproteobacteria bacterium]
MALSKERLQRLIDRSTDIVVATDRSGLVVYYNDGAKRSLGYTQEEVLDTHVGRLYPDVAEAKRVMAAMRSEKIAGKDIIETFQTGLLAKNGDHIPVAISGTLIFDEEGDEDGTIGYAKDLRDILHKDQLATLGEVAVGLSHEINNPLAVILNQAELLEGDVLRLVGDGDCSVEVERLDAMRREVGRIAQILDRLGEMVETDSYETIDYIGPARMVDLRGSKHLAEDAARWSERLGGLRILVVDDDAGICITLKEILSSVGCSVETAGDGVEALACLDAASFDLLLTDVVMPKMDGHELYLALQKDRPDLPVLMMTAFHYDKDHIIKRSRMKGLEGVIFKKPVDPARLRQVIAETVGR